MPIPHALKKQRLASKKLGNKTSEGVLQQPRQHTVNQQAFSLIEIAIVFCIASLLIAGLWFAAGIATTYIKTNQLAKDILAIASSYQAVVANTPGTFNSGIDGGCSIKSNACPAADPNSPGNYLKNVTHYVGTNAAGQTVNQTSSFGLINVTSSTTTPTDTPLSTVTGSLNSNCGSGTSYYTENAAYSGTVITPVAIKYGIMPSDLIQTNNTTNTKGPWGGTVDVSVGVSGESACAAGNNSSLLTTAAASLAVGSAVNINTQPGYTAGTISYSGQFIITSSNIPVTACGRLLASYANDFINRGLTQVCVVSSSGSGCPYGGTVSSSTGLQSNWATGWCSSPGVQNVTLSLYFNSYK